MCKYSDKTLAEYDVCANHNVRKTFRAAKLCKEVFVWFGLPECMNSDNESSFDRDKD